MILADDLSLEHVVSRTYHWLYSDPVRLKTVIAQEADERALSQNSVINTSYYECFIGMTAELNDVFQVCKLETEMTVSKLGSSDKPLVDLASQFGNL